MTKCIIALYLAMKASLSFSGPDAYALEVSTHICTYSDIYKVNPTLVLSVAYNESRFKHHLKKSKTQDIGLMQIHCPNSQSYNWCKKDLKNLEENIKTGIWLMSLYRSRCKHIKHHWIQHYNWNSKQYSRTIIKIQEKIRN